MIEIPKRRHNNITTIYENNRHKLHLASAAISPVGDNYPLFSSLRDRRFDYNSFITTKRGFRYYLEERRDTKKKIKRR